MQQQLTQVKTLGGQTAYVATGRELEMEDSLCDDAGNVYLDATVRLKCPLCGVLGDICVVGGSFMCASCNQLGHVALLAVNAGMGILGHPPEQTVETLRADAAAIRALRNFPLTQKLNHLASLSAQDMDDETFRENLMREAEDTEMARLFSEATQKTRKGVCLAPHEVIKLLNDSRDRPTPVKVNPVKQRTPEEHVLVFGEAPLHAEENPAVPKKLTLAQLAEIAGECGD